MNELNNKGIEIKDLKSGIHSLAAGNEDPSWGQLLGVWISLSPHSSLLVFFSFLPQAHIPLTSTLWAILNTNSLTCRLDPPPTLLLPWPIPGSSPICFQTQPWRTSSGRSSAGYLKNCRFHSLSPSRVMSPPVSVHITVHTTLARPWVECFGPVLSDRTFYNYGNALFLFLKIYFTQVYLIYNVVLISSVQQSDSVIYILFHILFHSGLSQDVEYSPLCYTVGPCCLSRDFVYAYESWVRPTFYSFFFSSFKALIYNLNTLKFTL